MRYTISFEKIKRIYSYERIGRVYIKEKHDTIYGRVSNYG